MIKDSINFSTEVELCCQLQSISSATYPYKFYVKQMNRGYLSVVGNPKKYEFRTSSLIETEIQFKSGTIRFLTKPEKIIGANEFLLKIVQISDEDVKALGKALRGLR